MIAKKGRVLYLDSSVLVSLALRDDPVVNRTQKKISAAQYLVSSELVVTECQSGLSFQSARLEIGSSEQNLNQILAAMQLMAVNSLVLGMARSLVKKYRASLGLRTLDAIHVATLLLVQQTIKAPLEYMTADRRQHEVLTVEGVLGTLIELG